MTNRHCYKYSTLVHRNVIAVEPSKDKNGFVMVQKRKNKTVRIMVPVVENVSLMFLISDSSSPASLSKGLTLSLDLATLWPS